MWDCVSIPLVWETFCSVVSKKSRDQRNDSICFPPLTEPLGVYISLQLLLISLHREPQPLVFDGI